MGGSVQKKEENEETFCLVLVLFKDLYLPLSEIHFEKRREERCMRFY
jgi:hypothetical protein